MGSKQCKHLTNNLHCSRETVHYGLKVVNFDKYLFEQIFEQNFQNVSRSCLNSPRIKKMKISYSAMDKAEEHVFFPPDQ